MKTSSTNTCKRLYHDVIGRNFDDNYEESLSSSSSFHHVKFQRAPKRRLSLGDIMVNNHLSERMSNHRCFKNCSTNFLFPKGNDRNINQRRSVRFALNKNMTYVYNNYFSSDTLEEADKRMTTTTAAAAATTGTTTRSCILPTSLWYSRKELRTIKKRDRIIISQIRRGTFSEGNHSARGLEHKIKQHDHSDDDHRRRTVMDAFHAVMDEQYRQQQFQYCSVTAEVMNNQNNYYDGSDAIAIAYHDVAFQSQIDAQERGIKDMNEAPRT